jgi:hypothetical protein
MNGIQKLCEALIKFGVVMENIKTLCQDGSQPPSERLKAIESAVDDTMAQIEKMVDR